MVPESPSSPNAASTSSKQAPIWPPRSRSIFSATSVSSTGPLPPPAVPPRRFELLRTHGDQGKGFAFVRPLIGFETFANGEKLIATDGPLEIRAPCDDCTIFMPARTAIVGREGVYLTQPLLEPALRRR